MKCLVTGGLGFIGSNLVSHLLKLKHTVTILDPMSSDKIFNSFDKLIFEKRKSLIQGAKILDESISEIDSKKINNFEFIFHLGMTSSTNEVDLAPQKSKKSILEDTLKLIEASSHSSLKKFVFLSSSMIYGDFQSDPQTEFGKFFPKSLYGQLKLEAETLVISECPKKNLDFVIIRPISVYGPYDDSRRFISKSIRQLIENKKMFFTNPNARLNLTYIDDLVQGIVKSAFCNTGEKKIYNLSGNNSYSLIEVAKALVTLFPESEYATNETTLMGVKRGQLSFDLANKAFGYQPLVEFQEGLIRTVNFYKGLAFQ